MSGVPPHGVFYNRMSASSQSSDHRYSPELAATVLAWLGRHGRVIVNDTRALDLEISKTRQYMQLAREGIPVPKTVAVVGARALPDAPSAFARGPLIVKPNRGGKGLGVRLYETPEQILQAAQHGELPDTIDGTLLVQEYIRSDTGHIYRAEFVGGSRFARPTPEAKSSRSSTPSSRPIKSRAIGIFCATTGSESPASSSLCVPTASASSTTSIPTPITTLKRSRLQRRAACVQSPITLAVCYPMFIGNSPNANSIRWSAARAQRSRSGLHLHRLTCFLFRVSRPLPFVVGADEMGAR